MQRGGVMTGTKSSGLNESELPEDSNTLQKVGDWSIYISKIDDCIFVKTDDYHAGPLKLSKEDLLKFVAAIDNSRKEIRQEIIAELETAFKEIIAKDKSREIFKGVKIQLGVRDRENKEEVEE